MKLNPTRQREAGLTLLAAAILFALFLVFIGTLVFMIWRALQRITPRTPPPDDPAAAALYQADVAALTAKTQQEFGTTNVTALYLTGIAQTNLIVFLPFGTNAYAAQIERSTNLVDWVPLGASPMGEAYIDTNPPPAQAFYRRLYLNVTGPVYDDTNHVAGFYYLPQ